MRTKRYTKRMGMWAVGLLLATALACQKKAPEAPQPGAPKPTAAAPGGAAPTATAPTAAVSGAKRTLTVPDPMAVAVPDVAVVVRVNRLDQLLSKVEALASQVSPAINADVLKAQLGNALRDPTLAGIDQTRPLLLAVFDPVGGKDLSSAALLPVTSAQYKDKFQAMGMNVYQKEGGKTLLLAEKEAGAVAGRQAFDQLEALMSQPLQSDISVFVNVEMMLTRHAAQIDAGVNQMTMMMEQMQKMGGQKASPAALVGLEARAVLSAAKEIKDLGVDVSISKDGVDLGAVLRAKPGTLLAKMFDDPTYPDPSLLGYVPGTGAIIGYMGGDNGPAADFLSAKLDEVFAATSGPIVAQIKLAELKKIIDRTLRLQKGVAYDLMNPGGTGLGTVSVTEVSNGAAYLNELKNLGKSLEAAGVMALYKTSGMNMEMAFKENVRNYGGVAIHQMITDVTMPEQPGMPPAFAVFMKSFLHQEYEVAAVGNYIVSDMGAKKMDTIIDALKAKKPLWTPALNAQKVFPKEGDLYCDILPGRLAAWGLQIAQPFIAPMMAAMGPEGEAMMARIKALETKPISFFLQSAQGKLLGRLAFPIDPILKIRQTIMSPPAAPPKAL